MPARTVALPYERSAIAESSLIARNVIVGGHRTSVRLEPVMWDALHEIAGSQDRSVNALVTEIDRSRDTSSLTAGIRVFIVQHYRVAAHAGSYRHEPAAAHL